jgi:aryl carrier-like protein
VLPADGHWPGALTPIVNRPLDLARDGAMRVDCWALPDASTLCVWTLHHFAIDEAAIDHALAELDALLRGELLAPTYGSPFAFAALEHSARDDAGMHEQAAQLARAWVDQAPPLPRPPGPGVDVDLELPDDTVAWLAQACQEWDCTPFTPLLVACALAQQQLHGPAWRFVQTPFSRRGEPELLEPVGCLLDLRLIEAGAREGEALEDTLQRVRAQVLQAQQPRFRPLEQLARALDVRAPGASVALTQFALTWRHDPLRTRSLGGATVEMLRVPQGGARFGQVLHLENTAQGVRARLEVMAQGLDDGGISAFGEAFVTQLRRVCAMHRTLLPVQPQPAPPRPVASPHVSSEAPRTLAGQAWQRWLGRAPESDDTHFLRSGGSSLLAMRLAATLRRDGGLALDVGAFLARPTFGALCNLLSSATTDADIVTLIGPQNAPRMLLVLPGMQVGALGMFSLAQALQIRLGDGCAVAIADTDEMMRRAPRPHRAHHVIQQLQQVVRDLGQDRIAGVVGYSAGGVLGIKLQRHMGPAWAARVPLWLLDTYAPSHMRPTKAVRARHTLVSLVRHPVALARFLTLRWRQRRATASRAQAAAEPGPRPDWRALMNELADTELDPTDVHAVLIHSSRAARTAGVWRHWRSNGFDPAHFGSLRVIARDCEHGDLRGAAVAWVADLVATHDAPTGQPG